MDITDISLILGIGALILGLVNLCIIIRNKE